nr:unnamed protein product [Callosobruchus analis]
MKFTALSDCEDYLSDPYATDEDDGYNPLEETESTTDDESDLDDRNSGRATVAHVTPKRSRKRQRRPETWKRNLIRNKRLRGEEYATKRKFIARKMCKEYVHTCRYKFNTFTLEERQRLFRKLQELPTYDLKTNFLASCIEKGPPRRQKINCPKKGYSTVITLLNRRVCRDDSRFKVVCKKIDSDGFVATDMRGRHQPKNKISPESRNAVINHIQRFPRYKSHYSRSQNCNTRYLSPDLNIRKMYRFYIEICKESNQTPVKESYYRHIFNSEFNLRFHYPHSDTCNTCDRLNNAIQHNASNSAGTSSSNPTAELELHQRQAKHAVSTKQFDTDQCKLVEDTVVICFDLQKTLPTPLLTTNKVYYLRQLWTYNLCIHDLTNDRPNMYVWNESVASRGSSDVGSCLLRFVDSLPPTITKVIAYSDSCGGQNKNKNLAKLFMYIVQSTNIKRIDHKLFVPGHSFMECDRDFALIEKKRKINPQVFVPEHWSDIIKTSSKKFEVDTMEASNFVSLDVFNSFIKDPKHDSEGRPLGWRTINKDEAYSFKFKATLSDEYPFLYSEKCFNKKGRPPMNVSLPPLYPKSRTIKYAKWENLQQLLDFIPPIYHDFYKNMPHTEAPQKKLKGKPSKKANASKETEATGEATQSHWEDDEFQVDDEYVLIESDYE